MTAEHGAITSEATEDRCWKELGERNAQLADANAEIERLMIEIAAIGIYNAFPYDGPEGTTKPAWRPFGNSLKQEEARSLARKQINRR